VHRLTSQETARLHKVRPATREELYRRVCRARDYAAAMFADPVTLGEMARVACLSPNHFLRTFREVFRQTPHQFLRARRLEEAKRLLAQPDLSVTEVCLAVGFESPGSFSTLFRERFGISPAGYRKKVIFEKRSAII
jgi:AraC family transcriptional regulator